MAYSKRVWACPFYRNDRKGKIYCEGGCVQMRKRTLDGYAERFCGSVEGWEKCSIARALVEEYERSEADRG